MKPLKVCVFVPKGPADHVEHLTAFAAGLANDPDVRVSVVDVEDGYVECDVAVVFGVGKRVVPASWPRGHILYEHKLRRKKHIIVLERGFIRRDVYYGAAWDGLNGLADFNTSQGMPGDRWGALGMDIKPWREPNPDGYHLVCGQVPWDATVQHTDHPAWCRDTIAHLQRVSDRRVVFRPHPQVADYDYGVEASKGTWDEDLAGAHAIYAFNSTSAALAILEGVPIFAFDRGSMAYEVASKEITGDLVENPWRPDREQWAHNLAYCQWTAEEMAYGETWQHLKRGRYD